MGSGIDWHAMEAVVKEGRYKRYVKAQRVQYGGRRLRSKLELSWAIYFDECQIEYVYEPENLRSPTGWLPDFALRMHLVDGVERVTLIEVKPTYELFIAEGGRSFYHHPDYVCLVYVGTPENHRIF